MTHKLLSCLFLLNLCLSNAQSTFQINEDAILFEDAKTNEPILVYNDSMAVRGFDFKEHIKIDFPKDLKLGHFNRYKYQIGGINYFVDGGNGGGVTLKYQNNSFTRIDNSFQHKNQYSAVHFEKDSVMYLFGGYGLFTYKNILTRFDFDKKEWFRVQTKNESIVPRGKNWSYILNDDDLYVFSPFMEDSLNVLNSVIDKNRVWQLNLSNFEWKQLKNHELYNIFSKGEMTSKRYIDNKIQINNQLIIFNNDVIVLTPSKDLVEVYELNHIGELRQLLYHHNKDYISILYNNPKNEYYVISLPYEDLKGDLILTSHFFEKPSKARYFGWGAGLVAMMGLFFTGFKVVKKRTKTLSISEPQLVYDIENDSFSYGLRNIEHLGPFKKDLLKAFMNSVDQYILLNDLNDLVSANDSDDNYMTLKKRRETLLKELKNELALITGKKPEQIFNVRKNEFDKRIKEIKLNLEIKKIS